MRMLLLTAGCLLLAGCTAPTSFPDAYLITDHVGGEWERMPEDHQFFQQFAGQLGMEENPGAIDTGQLCSQDPELPCPVEAHGAFFWVPDADEFAFNIAARFDDGDEAQSAFEEESCDDSIIYRGGHSFSVLSAEFSGNSGGSDLEAAAQTMAEAADFDRIC